ncbi:hypothetical protein ACMGDH_17260 [Sphingomonas sp. DT-207]|uniref:hypothetical protein n=1 Tax=Sphingomonas sp. DT-207 TaxID=3396167 RepID=UPI003F195B52
MFQADLDFRDFGAPYKIVDGALVFGSSFVRPLDHRMVHWRVLASYSRLVLIASERFCGSEEVSGEHRQLDDAEIYVELAAARDHLLDFAILLLDRREPRVQYSTSPVVSVPAYIHATGDSVLIDWDYARLLQKISVRPSIDIVLAQIAGRSIYDTRTVVEGLHRVTADSTITVTLAGLKASYPAAVEYEGPQEIVHGADLEAALFDTVSTIIGARPLSPANVAVEVSGGMDSALTALAAAGAIGGALLSAEARFNGAMGKAQDERRRLIIERGGFDDLAVPAERFAPFAPGTARRLGLNVLPDDENYPELFEVLFAALRSAGVDTLISGFGGDELYAIYEGEEEHRAEPDTSSPFLSTEGLQQAHMLSSEYPASWLQPSSWQSAAARSQRVLRFGLWPIYPYINTSLARFVSCLPYEYRRDRTLLRKALTKVLGNSIYETNYTKETFGAVARRGIEENKEYLIGMVRATPLYSVQQINCRAIIEALNSNIAELDKPIFEGLFRILKIFAFFQSEG